MKKGRFVGAILMIMALIVMLLPATEADAETSASDFVIENNELIKYKGTEVNVTVPGDVAIIGEGAFENNTEVEKVVLPDSVTQIKAYAFWGCERLRTVTLGKGLTAVGDYAFTNCDGLQTMTIPSTVRSIGIQAFSDCNRLEDIMIPPTVTSIKEDAFDRDYLLNIRCEEGSYADKYAKDFYERQKNMAVYTDESSGRWDIPYDGVYSGDIFASDDDGKDSDNILFDDFTGEILGSTRVVGNQAVVLMQSAGLSVLESEPEGQTDASAGAEVPWKITERTHYRDQEYTEGVLAADVREIGRFAYARSGLKNVTLPDGLEKIEYAAFYHCDDLNGVELPASVTAVEAKAFAHTPWVDNFLNGRDGTEGDFLISGDVLIAYRGNSEEVTVPDGVRVIAGEAFADHAEMRKISIPESVQYIDDDAFLGCNPTEIEYGGVPFTEMLSDMLLEERINLGGLSAAPREVDKITSATSSGMSSGKLPFTWILAGRMFVGGSICMLRRVR